MKTLLKNAMIWQDSHFTLADIAWENELLIPSSGISPDLILDARGGYLSPGFIDLHCHLRDPGYTDKEDIMSGTAAAAAGGFNALVSMPNTLPVSDSPEIIRYILQKGEQGSCTIYPAAACTEGSRGVELSDFHALKKAGVRVLTDDGQVLSTAAIVRQAVIKAAEEGLLLMDHCEEKSLSQGAAMNLSQSSEKMGVRGMPNTAESCIAARDILIAEELHLPIHLTHISTKESVRMIREAKSGGAAITADSCPHYFALTDSDCLEYGSLAKMYPPLRSEEDRSAIIEGFLDGTLDAISTDHAPHTAANKERPFSRASNGIIGLETAFPLAYSVLCREHGMPLEKLMDLMLKNPATLLKVEIPDLKPGKPASFVLFDLQKSRYDVSKSRSKSRNTPFDGWDMYGRILRTVWKGKTVYER